MVHVHTSMGVSIQEYLQFREHGGRYVGHEADLDGNSESGERCSWINPSPVATSPVGDTPVVGLSRSVNQPLFRKA